VIQPAAITKKKRHKKKSLLWRSYKHHYSSHIAAFFSTATIVSMQNDIFIAVGFWSTTISKLTLLKHIYCGSFMSHRCRTPQKTILIATVPKNTAIEHMYSGGPKKHLNM